LIRGGAGGGGQIYSLDSLDNFVGAGWFVAHPNWNIKEEKMIKYKRYLLEKLRRVKWFIGIYIIPCKCFYN
jgi:hypothetical protein